MKSLCYGVGVDDTGLVNSHYVGNKMVWIDPFFSRWKGMIRRCYAPCRGDISYAETHVCADWFYLSNFKEWMQSQEWDGRDLDKDYLCTHRSIYSPQTCAFIPKALNYFLGSSPSRRGDTPLGVSFDRNRNKYAAHIRVDGKSKGLGRFTTPQHAHRAYQKAKIDAGLSLMENYKGSVDNRVINSLSVILKKIEDDLACGEETHSILPMNLPERYQVQINGELPA